MRHFLSAIFVLAAFPLLAATPEGDNRFLAGYVSAVLEREFGLSASVSVADGVVSIDPGALGSVDAERLRAEIAQLPGVSAVRFAAAERAEKTNGLLPRGRLFDPLIADPRWPHFGAAYHYYIGDPELEHVGQVSFGEFFPFYRAQVPWGGEWSFGVQAGVFAIFALDAPSQDLINADYWVGLPVSWRQGNFSALGRVFHQSSHLGDEFLLRNPIDRVNLSYEGVDLKLSHDLPKGLRVYGGGGYLFRRDPEDLQPWSAQAGLEWRSPRTWANGALRPVAALDLQASQEDGWEIDTSLRAGLAIEGRYGLQLMLEYYDGGSPNGQFYDRDIQYLGLGLHGYF